MRHLHLDCPCGLGGDMLLAALCSLAEEVGKPFDLSGFADDLTESGVPVRLALDFERRDGLAGAMLSVEPGSDQPLRHLPEIEALIEKLPLPPDVRERSIDAFRRLAEAEAKAHGICVNRVHFHEVGAVDTVVDVVGAFLLIEHLNISRVTSSSLPWFTGTVVCEHGEIALPAPATANLLKGKPVYPTEFRKELITPTGALLLDRLVDAYTDGPDGNLAAMAVSYGTLHLPSGLRAILSDAELEENVEHIWLLETNIDHLTGEELGGCYDALLNAGALDVLYLQGVMKKNRPGGTLQVQCTDANLPTVQEAIFRHTLTLGLRRTRVERVTLPREAATMRTPHGEVEAKAFTTPDGLTHRSPEYEALRRLAEKTGRSVAELRYLIGGGEEN